MPDDKPVPATALVSIRYGETELHIEGPEAVVERALDKHLPVLARLLGAEGAPPLMSDDTPGLALTAQAEEPASGSTRLTLRTWYEERIVHPEGKRGRIQDHVLLFTWFLTQVRGAAAASTADIRQCFEELELKVPNVPVMVYNLKSKGSLIPGEGYASYELTPAGQGYIESRYSLVRRG